jgi:hypothetical protein
MSAEPRLPPRRIGTHFAGLSVSSVSVIHELYDNLVPIFLHGEERRPLSLTLLTELLPSEVLRPMLSMLALVFAGPFLCRRLIVHHVPHARTKPNQPTD